MAMTNPHSNRRGAYLGVTRDPACWGAFSVAPNERLRVAGGSESAPEGSTIRTARGQQPAPLEVAKSDPLNGLNIYEEISERGQSAGDDSGGSPASGLAAFHTGLKDAPDFVRARIRGLPTAEQPCSSQTKELL